MVQLSKYEKNINRKAKEEEQPPRPSDESIKESKDIVNQLREKIENEGTEKLRRDVLMCNVGH